MTPEWIELKDINYYATYETWNLETRLWKDFPG